MTWVASFGAVLVLIIGMGAAFWIHSRERLRRNLSTSFVQAHREKHLSASSSGSGRGEARGPSAAGGTITRSLSGSTRVLQLRYDMMHCDSMISTHIAEEAEEKRLLLGGKEPEDCRADDIKGLSKAEFLQLFYLLPAASVEELHGEWKGEALAMGLNFPLAYLILHWQFGPGWWMGKAFSKSLNKGYNLFFNAGIVSRCRSFDIFSGPSAYDDKISLHLLYAAHNDGLIGRLHDEIRCLNDDLFLGLGSSSSRRRTIFNSIPFIIVGPRKPLRECKTLRN